MGNCNCAHHCWRMRISRSSQKKVVLLLLGLENAGKTTVAKGLAHELEHGVVPTVGFSSVNLVYKKFTVALYDLGGGPGIRPIWHKYFVDAHGIIFVLDSSDIEKVAECRDVLRNLLSNDKLSGKPLLVLGNKQDVEGALDEIDIVEMLQLEDLVNQQKCPTLVETCSAVTLIKSHYKGDQVIQNSFKWLLGLIERDYDGLNSRVEKDVQLQKEKDQVEFVEKLKRVREARLSRDGCSNDVDFGGDLPQLENDAMSSRGNPVSPFKPIGDILDGRGDALGKDSVGDTAAELTDSSNSNSNRESNKKRLRRQNGISEEIANAPSVARNGLNCFCNESSRGSVANLLKSNKNTSARRFSLWRNNKTVPMDTDGSDGIKENSEPVWAIRLPSGDHFRQDSAVVNVPQAFTVCPPIDNAMELEDFAGMRSIGKGVAFPAMKG